MMFRRAFHLSLLLGGAYPTPTTAQSERQINGNASGGNYIHAEQEVELGYGATVDVTSNIPVTIQRYSDSGRFLYGQQPVLENFAKVLVTSNCETSQTQVIPVISVGKDAIDINLNVPQAEAESMPFLDPPSSYSAFWSWFNDFCLFNPSTPAAPLPIDPIPIQDECEVGPAADAAKSCPTGSFCQLEELVCNNKSGVHSGVCQVRPDACIEIYQPVCGCDEKDYGNFCFAQVAGTSISRQGTCDSATTTNPTAIMDTCPEGQCRDPDGECMGVFNCLVDPCSVSNNCGEGEVCRANYCGGCNPVCMPAPTCEVGPAADPTTFCGTRELCELEPGVCNTFSGVHNGVCVTKPEACMAVYDPVCGCDGITYSNDCVARSNGTSVSYEGQCVTQIPTVTTCEVDPAADPVKTCETGEFCELKSGVCNTFSGVQSGVCAPKPEACILMYAPVCGCDGITYGNDCAARSNGTSVSHEGDCDVNIVIQDPTPSCPESLIGVMRPDPDAVLYYAIVPPNPPEDNNGLLCARLEVNSESWVAFAVSEEGKMIGSNAIIGLPDENLVLKYDLNGKSAGQVVAMADDKQTLMDTAIVQEGGKTTIEFTKMLVEDGEIAILEEGLNNFLYASGRSNSLGYHATRVSFVKDFVEDIVEDIQNIPAVTVASTTVATSSPPETTTSTTTNAESPCPAGQCRDPDGECMGVFNCLVDPCSVNNSCGEGEVCRANYCGGCLPVCIPAPTCEVGPAADPTTFCGTRELCELEPGVCNTFSGVHNGVCVTKPEACMAVYDPVCGCDGITYSNDCVARSNGTSVSREGDCAATTVSTTTTPTTSGAATVSSTAGTTSSAETTTSADTTTSTTSADTITTDTTSTATPSTAAKFGIDGDFPTEAPMTKGSTNGPTASPSTWWEMPNSDGVNNPNSAFNLQRSFSFRVVTTFIIVMISVMFPANGNNPWMFGKFAVAAMAVTSLYSKKTPASKGGNIRKNNQGPKSIHVQNNERALQTCNFNVEILLDGCNHPLQVVAPSGRIVGAAIENVSQQQSPDDDCVTDYEADITFPVTDTPVLGLPADGTVPTLEQWGGDWSDCARAVIGRPFVDATGGSLQAMPWIPGDKDESAAALSWTGEALMEVQASFIGNATTQFLLGEDWTQRALGEHASVASFSAFSIALMTNQAPSDLVVASFKAGLDEIRHAKTSFDIASKLTGRDVGPSALPESKLEFSHDLKALALAVAREGCVDETLSAFAAAVEVEHINEVLENSLEETQYYNIDRDLLTYIRNELVKIAMDESNHSALAWRTLNWVCSVDLDVCDDVHRDVFEESNLEKRFNLRADGSFGEKTLVLHSMREEWKKIFSAHKLAHSGQSICVEADVTKVGGDHSGQPLLASVTENVLHQVVCS
ncbi:hypothetical protein ACHAXR_011295 [Thalassiosira sp. AJA248-18]